MCGLLISPCVEALEECLFDDTRGHTRPLVLVKTQVAYDCRRVEAEDCFRTEPNTRTVRLLLEYLDDQKGRAAWKFWFRVDNPASSSGTKAVKLSATINNKSCEKGPYTLRIGGFVESSCTIQPEPSPTGLYAMVITTDKDPHLQYNYLICQKN
jgi:hypothetical protein